MPDTLHFTPTELRAALTPELVDALDYVRAYEHNEGAMPQLSELAHHNYLPAYIELRERGVLAAVADTARVRLTAKGVAVMDALDQLDQYGPGTVTTCPVDGSLQWIMRETTTSGFDPTAVLHLACGHVSL